MAPKVVLKLNLFWRLWTPPAIFFASLGVLLFLSSCTLIDPILPAVNPSAASTPSLPTATADPSGRYIAHLSTSFGVSLRYPPNWVIGEDDNLQVATSAELLIDPDQLGTGALLQLVPAPDKLIETNNLATALRNYVIDLGDFKVVEEPDNVLMGGQPAATLTAISLSNTGTEITHIFSLIKNGQTGIVAEGLTSNPKTHDAPLRAILGTIIVSRLEPTPAPPTLTPAAGAGTTAGTTNENNTGETGSFGGAAGVTVEASDIVSGSQSIAIPAGLLQFQSSDNRFSLGYPSDWHVRDDGSAIIFASTNELLIDNKFETGATALIFPQALSTPAEPDPVKFLEDFILQFAIYDTLELVIPPRPIKLGGQNAAHAQYDVTFQRYPVLVDYYVVVKGENIVIMVNLITAKDFEILKPVTDGMAASITINR